MRRSAGIVTRSLTVGRVRISVRNSAASSGGKRGGRLLQNRLDCFRDLSDE